MPSFLLLLAPLSRVLDAPNVLTVPLPQVVLQRAREHFDVAIRPHLEGGLIEALDQQHVPCKSLTHDTHGAFFVMRAGSSTDASKVDTSDLSWISVDDMETWETFRSIFDDSGVAEAVASLVETRERVRLYSSFYVVRSRCAAPNWHADWSTNVGTNAWTLLAPLEDYKTEDFQLLFRDSAGAIHQYRYNEGEAILFGSHFMHSTEPGCAVGGAAAPHVFLCFTFGCDDIDFYEKYIAPTRGYQSRMLVAANGEVRLTEIGQYLADADYAEAADTAAREESARLRELGEQALQELGRASKLVAAEVES